MICIPIAPSGLPEAQKMIEQASLIADIIELRLDYSDDLDLQAIKSFKCSKPIIVTNRKKDEGGFFKKTEQERLAQLQKAIELDYDYIDIEYSTGTKEILQIRELCKNKNTKLIISYHNFKDTSNEIFSIYEKIKILNPDIIKIAVKANKITDNLLIFELLKTAQEETQKIIALCMGKYGEISRILGRKYGNYLTFTKLSDKSMTADGQIDVNTMISIYHYHKIDKKTKVYGLVGNPVNKSKGYIIHNQSFIQKNINAVYLNFLVHDLNHFISNFRKLFDGLSITMPFKEEIIPYLDDIDDMTKGIGAVNTIIKKDGKLIGYNTDYIGALKSLEEKTNLKDKNILILGAGGVSKAIATALSKKQSHLFITDIDKEKAKSLASKTNSDYICSSDIDANNVDIIINATPVGMHPNINISPINKALLRENMLIFDCIYNPVKTLLLKDAESLGASIISGLELFLNQAAKQFELWTGKKPDLKLMKSLVTMKKIQTLNTIDVKIVAPPSKSYTNRALIISALAKGTSVIKSPLLSEDTYYMSEALKKLGVGVLYEHGSFIVKGNSGLFKEQDSALFIGNAGTAMRFLTGLATLVKGKTLITGNQRMQKRPILDLLDALKQIGIFSKSNGGFPPVEIYGVKPKRDIVKIKGDKSSQYFSSIMMVSPYYETDITIDVIGELTSKSYIDITMDIMKSFGAKIINNDYKSFLISGENKYLAQDYTIEGDASNASYFFAAAAIIKGKIEVANINPNSSQGDIHFIDLLEKMGCNVIKKSNSIIVEGHDLTGIEIDMNLMPDTVQTLAVVALFAKGKTSIKNIANLRIKETDRIKALEIELRKLGAKIKTTKDSITIIPSEHYHGAEIETYDDHRMAMSFSLAGLKIPGVSIKDPDCVSKSFPRYWEQFKKLYS